MMFVPFGRTAAVVTITPEPVPTTSQLGSRITCPACGSEALLMHTLSESQRIGEGGFFTSYNRIDCTHCDAE